MPRFPAFVGGSGILQSVVADAEDTVNWYVERAQTDHPKSPMALFPTPGFSTFATTTDVGGRGACTVGGPFGGVQLFMAVGNTLYEVKQDGTVVNRGALAQDSNPAQLFYNGVVGGQIGIASGGNFYVYTIATTTLTTVLTGETTMAAYAGGFFFSFNASTGKVKLSALNDGTNFSGGQFFQRSLFPDPWQAMFTDQNNLLWLVGSESFEAWYNTGAGTQPWAPLSGLTGLMGIAAPFAFCRNAQGLFWLSGNREGVGELVQSTGGLPQPISTYAFGNAVAGYLRTARIANAEMLTYQQEGHTFVCTSFPAAPATWVCDLGHREFAKRGKWNSLTGTFDLWAPRVVIPAFRKLLAASWTDATIATMDTSLTTEFDGVTGIVRERTTPAVIDEHKRIAIDQLELLMDVGLASGTGVATNPQATLRQSGDGGRVYGNERMASMGRIGEYRRRVFWNQLGANADTVFKVRTSDPAPSRIIDAWLNNVEAA